MKEEKRKNQKKVRIPDYAAMIALAFIFSYLESLIPLPVGIPGVKLGLANLVVVLAMYQLNAWSAVVVGIVRILLVGLSFGNLSSMLYSLAGGLLSLCVMLVLKQTGKFHIIGVSLAGGVFHNIGQLLVAAWLLETGKLVYYAPVLMVAGVVTGGLIGVAANAMCPVLKRWSLLLEGGSVKKSKQDEK